jgi:hypothetical protein
MSTRAVVQGMWKEMCFSNYKMKQKFIDEKIFVVP